MKGRCANVGIRAAAAKKAARRARGRGSRKAAESLGLRGAKGRGSRGRKSVQGHWRAGGGQRAEDRAAADVPGIAIGSCRGRPAKPVRVTGHPVRFSGQLSDFAPLARRA